MKNPSFSCRACFSFSTDNHTHVLLKHPKWKKGLMERLNTRKAKEAHLQRIKGIPLTHIAIEKKQTHKETDFPSSIDLQSFFVSGQTHSHNANASEKDTVPRLKWSHCQDQWAALWQERSWKVGSSLPLAAPTCIIFSERCNTGGVWTFQTFQSFIV